MSNPLIKAIGQQGWPLCCTYLLVLFESVVVEVEDNAGVRSDRTLHWALGVLSGGEEVLLDEVVLVDAIPTAEAVVLARKRIARLSLCLCRLNEKTREIFLLHRVDGLSYREIAQRHQLSISTVEKHIAKATLQVTSWMEGW